MPYFKYAYILAIVKSVSLSLGFVCALKDKGYVDCKEIPPGWPYVINDQLCHKKSLHHCENIFQPALSSSDVIALLR